MSLNNAVIFVCVGNFALHVGTIAQLRLVDISYKRGQTTLIVVAVVSDVIDTCFFNDIFTLYQPIFFLGRNGIITVVVT